MERHSGGLPESSGEATLKIHLSPILREALAAVKPGEDFDEALLRALKARQPQHATVLLSAFSHTIEAEMRRTNETKQQTLARLAQAEPGPEITLQTSGSEPRRTTVESRSIMINGKEYGSLEEAPPEFRRALEATLRDGRRVQVRTGCLSMLLGGWLVALLGGPRR